MKRAQPGYFFCVGKTFPVSAATNHRTVSRYVRAIHSTRKYQMNQIGARAAANLGKEKVLWQYYFGGGGVCLGLALIWLIPAEAATLPAGFAETQFAAMSGSSPTARPSLRRPALVCLQAAKSV